MQSSDAAPSPRREYAKTAQRRQEIISAAVEVFSESGFRDGTLRTVAERAGITHAGMRHHFPTKVDLLEAVLRWREEDTLTRARLTHPAGRDVIRAWIESVGENSGRPALVELEAVLAAEAIAADHPAHIYFNDLYRTAEDVLRRAFETVSLDGGLRSDLTPDAAGRLMLGATLGLQSLWLRDRSIDVPAELRMQANTLLTAPL